MNTIIEIHDNYQDLGIDTRKITVGVEFEMVKGFVNYKKERFKPEPENQLAIFMETKIYNSYPDVVFVEHNPVTYENWSPIRDELTISDLKVLHHMYLKRNISSQEMVRHLGITYKEVLIALEKLLESGIIEIKNQLWHIKQEKIFGINKLEAVEAKIKNMDIVFQQALINKCFASESYVLSKIQTEPKKETVERFRHFGIGLYIFNSNGFEKVYDSKKMGFPKNYTSIYFNECIGRILNNSKKEVMQFA